MNTLSGYIELELCGDKLPFKFGTNAWSLFCGRRKIEFYDIFRCGIFGKFSVVDGKEVYSAEPDIFALQELYYDAYVTAVRIKKETAKYNFEEFVSMLDETPGAMLELQKALLQSKLLGYTFTELAKGEDKGNFQNP